MPELYTFVTEKTDNIEALEEIKKRLKEEKIDFTVHKVDDIDYYFLAGYNWEEDCGYPPELTLVFSGSEITCVYCNNHLYGVIDGGSWDLYFNTTLSDVPHYSKQS